MATLGSGERRWCMMDRAIGKVVISVPLCLRCGQFATVEQPSLKQLGKGSLSTINVVLD